MFIPIWVLAIAGGFVFFLLLYAFEVGDELAKLKDALEE